MSLSAADRRAARRNGHDLGALGVPAGTEQALADERAKIDVIVRALEPMLPRLGGTQGVDGARLVGVRQMTDAHIIDLEFGEPLSSDAQRTLLAVVRRHTHAEPQLTRDDGSSTLWRLNVPFSASPAATAAASRRTTRTLLVAVLAAVGALLLCYVVDARYVRPCEEHDAAPWAHGGDPYTTLVAARPPRLATLWAALAVRSWLP